MSDSSPRSFSFHDRSVSPVHRSKSSSRDVSWDTSHPFFSSAISRLRRPRENHLPQAMTWKCRFPSSTPTYPPFTDDSIVTADDPSILDRLRNASFALKRQRLLDSLPTSQQPNETPPLSPALRRGVKSFLRKTTLPSLRRQRQQVPSLPVPLSSQFRSPDIVANALRADRLAQETLALIREQADAASRLRGKIRRDVGGRRGGVEGLAARIAAERRRLRREGEN